VVLLLDQEVNNTFTHSTDLLQFGHRKFITSVEDQNEFLLVVSCQLKQKVYMYGNLDVTESQYILSTIQRKLMSMKSAKFTNYLLKEDFD
jgi:hypothetical protein